MRPPDSRKTLLAAVFLALSTAHGCVWAPELADVKQDLARQMPDVGFRKNVTLTLGPLTMALARTVTGLVPDAREARAYLRDVSRVQVAVYEVDGSPGNRALKMPSRLGALIDDGWEMAVRVHEEHEVVWLLYRVDGDSVRELFVVVMGDEELVLVKIKGRLEHLMAQALERAHGQGGFTSGDAVLRL